MTRSAFRALLVVAVLGVLVVVVRRLAATRAPQAAPGHGPVVGSLDTWPAVPRNPAATAGGSGRPAAAPRP